MKRKIITINEDLCNGCGECVTACAEGALRIVNGKAKLVKENFCDGFGACIGECPTGALKIEEREAEEYDPAAARTAILASGDAEALRRFDEAAAAHAHGPTHDHGHTSKGIPPLSPIAQPVGPSRPAASGARTMPMFGGCPGSRVLARDEGEGAAPVTPTPTGAGLPPRVHPSELRQWPIQLHLVPPGAPFFRHKELVIMSTCGPLASADAHWRFLRGRSVVVACPKLDRTEPYVDKLAAIFADPTIPKAIVVRMEVPCCGGLTAIAAEAVRRSGRRDLILEETTLSLDGAVIASRVV